jgi:uncharacterized protein (TIGR02145 family)
MDYTFFFNIQIMSIEISLTTKSYWIIFMALFFISSCQREFTNPYDTDTPSEAWRPNDFNYTITGNNSIELNWTQPNMLIDGFTLVKRKNGIETTIQLSKDVLEYNDIAVLDSVESSSCTPVSYSMYARAGAQKSSFASLPVELTFPQPTLANAGIDVLASSITVNLSANDLGSTETGLWTIVSGQGGAISNANSPNISLTGSLNEVYVLKWAVSSCNTVTSDQVVVTYPNAVSDIDGNIYSIQLIGTQEWLSENLKTTRYRNGDLIPNLTSQAEWPATSSGAWCNYNNAVGNDTIYGKLYNWYAIADSRKICPVGWHIPSDADWSTLVDYLGGENVAGGKMKTINFWNTPNVAATNECNFNGLPGGGRGTFGTFFDIGSDGYWWNSNENSASNAWSHNLSYLLGNVTRNNYPKHYGYSVRCLKD